MSSNKFLHDAALPGLETALDLPRMTAIINGALSSANCLFDVVEVRVDDVRYKPGELANILYRLKIRDLSTGRHKRQLAAVVFRPSGQSLEANGSQESNSQQVDGSFFGLPEVTPLSVLNAHLTLFPADAAMPQLKAAMDHDTARLWLNRCLKARLGHVHRLEATLLGYTPETRAAIDYSLQIRSDDHEELQSLQLIGKTNAHKDAGKLFANAWALWREADGRISLAEPIGYIEQLQLSFQTREPGRRLGSVADEPGFENTLRHIGHDLALMHGLHPAISMKREVKDELRSLMRWANVLQSVNRDVTQRVQHLSSALASILVAESEISAPVHGDFHHSNILVEGDHVTLVDLDEMSWGDPHLDIGRLIASLRIPALRLYEDVNALVPAGEAFLDEYRRHREVDMRRVRTFEAASLITSAAAAFRIQRPNWRNDVDVLLDAAESTFENVGSRKRSTPVRHNGTWQGDFRSRSSWAKDGNFVRARLAPYVHEETPGTEITGLTVVGSRDSSDGCQIKYRLKGVTENQFWSRNLRGYVWRRGGARTIERHLTMATEALAGLPHAPRLPRPIAYLSPISTLIVEVPEGSRLTNLIRSTEPGPTMQVVANGLSALAMTSAEDVSAVISLRRKLCARLRANLPQILIEGADLNTTMDSIERALALTTADPVWGPRALSAHDIVVDGDSIGLVRPRNIQPVPAQLPAAMLIADIIDRAHRDSLADHGFTHDSIALFRSSFMEGTGISAEQFAPYEALALLQVATRYLGATNNSDLPLEFSEMLQSALLQMTVKD